MPKLMQIDFDSDVVSFNSTKKHVITKCQIGEDDNTVGRKIMTTISLNNHFS